MAKSPIIFPAESSQEIYNRFADEAKRRGKTVTQLAGKVLELVATDNLFAAVLDD